MKNIKEVFKGFFSKLMVFISNILSKINKKVIVGFIIGISLVFIISFGISIKCFINYFSRVHSTKGIVVSVVENLDSNYGTYNYDIEFYDGDEFYNSSVSSDKNYDIDDQINIYYNSIDNLYLERDSLSIVIIPIICIPLVLGLLLFLKKGLKVEKDNNKIIKDNMVVFARIDNITFRDVNNKRVYNIVCSWINPNDNKNYTFISQDIDFDPTMSIRVSNKNSLNVYLDKNDYNKYIVDIKDILNNKI